MALNTSKCNHLMPLRFKGLITDDVLVTNTNVSSSNVNLVQAYVQIFFVGERIVSI